MSRTVRVAVDAGAGVARSIAAAARLAPPLVLTHRSLNDLAAELGGYDQAAPYLLRTAPNAGKPIGVNAPTGPDSSRTWFIPPKGWTQEKAAGWIAAHHAELECAFGDATPLWEGL